VLAAPEGRPFERGRGERAAGDRAAVQPAGRAFLNAGTPSEECCRRGAATDEPNFDEISPRQNVKGQYYFMLRRCAVQTSL